MRTKRSLVFCFAVLVTGLTAGSEEFNMRVMTYNIYRGGTIRGPSLSQTANVIREVRADVVGIQETRSPRGVHGKELAKLPGWNHFVDRRNRSVLTPHHLVERHRGGIKIKLSAGGESHVFNYHLPSNPYQP